jgi:hypothetical protein
LGLTPTVTTIGDYAFQACFSLTSVIIGNGVTTIGSSAFARCSSLTSVVIGNSVTTIGDSAFWGCSSLTSVTIPNSVTNIGNQAFASCASLITISVDEISPAYSSVGGVLFNKTLSALVAYPAGKAGPYVIPDSVSSIGSYAFVACGSLDRVYFAGNAPSVGTSLFNQTPATLYHLPDATGWTPLFAGRLTVQWNPRILTDGGMFDVQSGQFGFTIMGAANVPVAIEACSVFGQPKLDHRHQFDLRSGRHSPVHRSRRGGSTGSHLPPPPGMISRGCGNRVPTGLMVAVNGLCLAVHRSFDHDWIRWLLIRVLRAPVPDGSQTGLGPVEPRCCVRPIRRCLPPVPGAPVVDLACS